MSNAEAVLRQALELGDEGRWEEMALLLAGALEEDPEDPYLLCWLGVAERELGNDGAAYERFRQAVAENPSDPHLLAIAGAGLAAFDDADAEPALRAAALTGPDLVITRLHYGAYLARAGLFEEALEHLRAAVALAPDDPVVHGELGTALALQGDMRGAEHAMEEALALAPEDSWTQALLGLVRVELGDAEHGATDLLAAAEERAEDGEIQLLAALAAAGAGWEDAAQDVVARAAYAVEGADVALMEQVEARLAEGPEAAARFLRQTAGPSALRDRLSQPL
ncbi:MAG: tetratricopeptide repeat protein [Gemmatimonadota bacterium]